MGVVSIIGAPTWPVRDRSAAGIRLLRRGARRPSRANPRTWICQPVYSRLRSEHEAERIWQISENLTHTSGLALAEVATAAVPRTGSPIVLELGPGTGAFTGIIQQRLAGSGRHVAVEVNPRFAGRLAALGVDLETVKQTENQVMQRSWRLAWL